MWKAVCLFALCALCALTASPACAEDKPLCAALDGLKTEARVSGMPQRVSVIKEEEMTFACQRRKEVAAQDAFCKAAMDAVGLEFTHAFPWKVRDCLVHAGIHPGMALADQYSGLRHHKKIGHLWAGWRDGTRIDILFKPSGDFGDTPMYRDYWGRYDVVVWRPED